MKRVGIGILWLIAFAAGFGLRWSSAPTYPDLVERIQQRLQRRETEQARVDLIELTQRFPDQANSAQRLLLAKLSSDRQDWETAVAALRPIPDSDEQAVVARIAEGDAWRRLNRARDAQRCWESALRLDPEARQARNGLLYFYSVQLRREEWMRTLWELYDRNQAGERELLQLLIAGQVVWETKALLEEVAAYAAADPEDLDSRRALATYLFRAGQAAAAIEKLQTLHREFPDDIEIWIALLECLTETGDAEGAEIAFNSQDRFPEETLQVEHRYWKSLGTLRMVQEDFAAAARAYRKSAKLFPFDLEVRNKLAQSLRLLNEAEEAKRHAEAARQLSMIQRLCHTIETNGWELERAKQLIGHCENVGLIEEAIGWVTISRRRAPDDAQLQAMQQRLSQAPKTSARNAPSLKEVM